MLLQNYTQAYRYMSLTIKDIDIIMNAMVIRNRQGHVQCVVESDA